MKHTKTQSQHFYSAVERETQGNLMFLELVNQGLTRAELETLIAKRPSLYARFQGWLNKLPA